MNTVNATCSIKVRTNNENPNRKYPRVYVSIPQEFQPHYPRVEDFPHLNLETVYTERGEYPEVDYAWDKANREWISLARFWAKKGLNLFSIKYDKISFSRKAGCSCDCSPGFILKGTSANKDFYVSVHNLKGR